MANVVQNGKPYAGNSHVRFDEGKVASEKLRPLLYNRMMIRVCVACGLLMSLSTFAREIPEPEARTAAMKWLSDRGNSIGRGLRGRKTRHIRRFGDNGRTLFHVVEFEGGGYVVASGDTSVTPILAMSDRGSFGMSPNHPLHALLRMDVSNRLSCASAAAASVRRRSKNRARGSRLTTAVRDGDETAETRWTALTEDGGGMLYSSSSGGGYVNPIPLRHEIGPLLKTSWNQSDGAYYTPSNCVCGCGPIACIQVMKYWRWPETDVVPVRKNTWVFGSLQELSMFGGRYDWEAMPDEGPIDERSRQAIGKLAYDFAITSESSFTVNGTATTAPGCMRAFQNFFGYKGGVWIVPKSRIPSAELSAQVNGLVLPSLDAGMPCIFGIQDTSGKNAGHFVVADGYERQGAVLYLHLNCGWGGNDNTWYNVQGNGFTSLLYDYMSDLIVNLNPKNVGNVVSGRVLDANGEPIANATVYFKQMQDGVVSEKVTTTDERGVYVFNESSGTPAPFRITVSYRDSVVESDEMVQAESSGVLNAKVEDLVLEGDFDIAKGTLGALKWKITHAGVLEISGVGTMPNLEVTGCPWREWSGEVVALSIDDGVTTVADGAFAGFERMTSVSLPQSLLSIGTESFSGCSGLSFVAVPSGVMEIGSKAFEGCSLVAAEVPDMEAVRCAEDAFPAKCVLSDGNYLASGAAGTTFWRLEPNGRLIIVGNGVVEEGLWNDAGIDIKEVLVGEGVTEIGNRAFSTCRRLKSILLPSSLKRIGKHAFGGEMFGCLSLDVVDVPAGVKEICSSAFANSGLAQITLHESLESIGMSAFADASLRTIELPRSLKTVASTAFDACHALEIVKVRSGNTVLEDGAFRYLSHLQEVWFEDNPPLGAGVAQLIEQANKVYYPRRFAEEFSAIVPPEKFAGFVEDQVHAYGTGTDGFSWSLGYDGVLEVLGVQLGMPDFDAQSEREWRFYKNDIREVRVRPGVLMVSDNAFAGCVNLVEVSFPRSVKSIGKNAFGGCSNLVEVDFQEGVTNIGVNAFSGCGRLESIDLPASLVRVDEGAFGGCGKLRSVFADNAGMAFSTDSFPSACTVVKGPEVTVTFETGDRGCRSGGGVLRQRLHRGESAILPEVTPADGWRFVSWDADVSSVTEDVVVRARYEILGTAADGEGWELGKNGAMVITKDLNDCTYYWSPWKEYRPDIRAVYVEEGATVVPAHAFDGCTEIQSVVLASSVTSVGASAFPRTITRVSMPSSLNCVDVFGTGVESLEVIGCKDGFAKNAFARCENLRTVRFFDDVHEIGASAFLGCTNLTTVILPPNLETLSDWAFSHCERLREVRLPRRVKVIGSLAFYYCHDLRYLDLPEELERIENSAFEGCASLEYVELPAGVTNVQSLAFAYCPRLSSAKLVPFFRLSEVFRTGDGFWGSDPLCGALKNVYVDPATVEVCDAAFKDCSGIVTLSIPDGVVRIGSEAFRNCGKLESVDLPDVLEEIGESCFYGCGSLTDLALPTGLRSIGDMAFYRCRGFCSLDIPESVLGVGTQAFASCDNLKCVILHSWDTVYEDDAFPDGCSILRWSLSDEGELVVGDKGVLSGGLWDECKDSIRRVVIKDGLTQVSANAFAGCQNLKSVTISDSVASLGERAFAGCVSLMTVEIPSRTTEIGAGAFAGCGCLLAIAVPPSVAIIGSGAFDACSGLKTVYIAPGDLQRVGKLLVESGFSCEGVEFIEAGPKPDGTYSDVIAGRTWTYSIYNGEATIERISSGYADKVTIPRLLGGAVVTALADWALEDSTVKIVELPSNMASIGSFAFANCSVMMSITIDPDNLWYSSDDGILYDKQQTRLVRCPPGRTGSVIISSGVTSIGDGAFSDCGKLTAVEMPNSVTNIGMSAFKRCVGLTGVVIPDSVTKIGLEAFYECGGMKSVKISENLREISYCAFGECSSLTSVLIPSGVRSVESSAFRDCVNLDSVMLSEGVEVIGWSAFEGCIGLTTVYLPSTLNSVGDDAFYNCSGLRAVHICDLGKWAEMDFSDWSSNPLYYAKHLYLDGEEITNLVVPEGTTHIGSHAFTQCASLTSLSLPAGLTSIGDGAFADCSSLTCVSIPEGVVSIDGSAFRWCRSLVTVTIPSTVSVIKEETFQYCYDLETVTIPSSVTSIARRAFDGCHLSTIYVKVGDVKRVKDMLSSSGFGDAYRLTYIEISTCHTVTFDLDGKGVHTGGGDLLQSVRWSDAAVDPVVTAKAGYKFAGWDRSFSTVVEDVTVRARYLRTENVGGVEWTFGVENGVAFIENGKSSSIDVKTAGTVAVPSALGGYNVVGVGSCAFYSCGSLTAASIPEGVESIGYNAFRYCRKLEAVVIPSTMRSIGYCAFEYCDSLKTIYVSPGDAERVKGLLSEGGVDVEGLDFVDNDIVLTVVFDLGAHGVRTGGGELVQTVRMGNAAVLPEVNVEDGWVLKGWEREPFCVLSNMTFLAKYQAILSDGKYEEYVNDCTWTYVIKDGEASVGGGSSSSTAVSEYTRGAITIPSMLGGCPVTSIGDYAFYRCSELTSVTIPAGVRSIGKHAFDSCSKLTAMTIPGGVVIVDQYAFSYCHKLSSVMIPDSVTDIGAYAFRACDGLALMRIPSGVMRIGENAFHGCWALLKFEVDQLNASYSGREGLLCNKDGTSIVCCPMGMTTLVIPNGVTGIGEGVFRDCSKLVSVTMPEDVTAIGSAAFYGCSSLTSVVIPNAVTNIGDEAFYGCASLATVTIPSSVACVENYAFYGCSGLKTVMIPGSVVCIGDYAFHGCSGLKTMTISDGVSCIGDYAFYGCRGLTTLPIPGSVASVGRYAFSQCTSLTGVVLGEGVKSIGEYAFYSCLYLKDVAMPNSLTNIGAYAFKSCKRLFRIMIPRGVVSIGVGAVDWCDGLTEISVDPSNLHFSARDGVLYDKEATTVLRCLEGLSEVTISDGVTNIGDNAFYHCNALLSITIPKSVMCIGEYAFQDCSALTSVAIPDGVTSVGSYAFSSCNVLSSVAIPKSVKSIGYRAFLNCLKLQEVFVCVGDAERVKGLISSSGGVSVSKLNFKERLDPAVPAIKDDGDAKVEGDAEHGFIVRPSAGVSRVEVTIPQGVDATKVTVEVSPSVVSVALPDGVKLQVARRLENGEIADITNYLDMPAAVNGVIDLSAARVKNEIVQATLDISMGAKIELSATAPRLTTSTTRKGLIYTLYEGRSLEEMTPGDRKVGDGSPWLPEITVLGGNSAFYSIDVNK